jgi:hypothetical protein
MEIWRRMIGTIETAVVAASIGVLAVGCTAQVDEPPITTLRENVVTGVPIIGDIFNLLLPTDVREAGYAVIECNDELAECIRHCSTPSGLAACNQADVQCVADALKVQLPDVPLSEVIGCAEGAAQCTLDASTLEELTGCATGLTSCALDTAGVGKTVDKMIGCTTATARCTLDSGLPSEAVECAEAGVDCVASTLGVDLPDLPAGELTACTESAAQCTLAARRVADIAACAADLTGCAADAVKLIDIIDNVAQCTANTAACVTKARRPSALAACGEAEVDCVAGGLGVNLPEIPVSEATACAEEAAKCAIGSRRLSDVVTCAGSLVGCAESVVEEVPVVDCAALFTKCLLSNPLRFFECARKSQACLKP